MTAGIMADGEFRYPVYWRAIKTLAREANILSALLKSE